MTMETERLAMVDRQIAARGIADEAVLRAMRTVPRERFVEPALSARAYDDRPLPIGEGQTISQPYIVAAMAEALRVRPGDRVLEVGAGSGYAAAVLAEMGATVYAVERIPALAESAAGRLRALGYPNASVRTGDGSAGWPDAAPFDAILVSAAAAADLPVLEGQLAAGGRMVVPVGDAHQQTLWLITRRAGGTFDRASLGGVMFVPLIEDPR